MPFIVRALAVVAAAITVALAGRAVLRRLVDPARVSAAEKSADLAMEAMAGMYGVLLAFMLGGAWERLGREHETVAQETAALAELGRLAGILPAPLGVELARVAERYREIARQEVSGSAAGRRHAEADSALQDAWSLLVRFEPRTAAEEELHSFAFDAVRELSSQRRNRVAEPARAVHPILWLVLIGGAAAVLSLVAVSSPGSGVSAAYLALLTGVIALALYGLHALSSPRPGGLVSERDVLLFSAPDEVR